MQSAYYPDEYDTSFKHTHPLYINGQLQPSFHEPPAQSVMNFHHFQHQQSTQLMPNNYNAQTFPTPFNPQSAFISNQYSPGIVPNAGPPLAYSEYTQPKQPLVKYQPDAPLQQAVQEQFPVNPFPILHEEPSVIQHDIPLSRESFDSFPNISTDLSDEEKPSNTHFAIYPTPNEDKFPSYVKSSQSYITMGSANISTPLASPPSSGVHVDHRYNQQDFLQTNSLTSPRGHAIAGSHTNSTDSMRNRVTKNTYNSYKQGKSGRARSLPNISARLILNKAGLHTTQPGPIPASNPEVQIDPKTGNELLTFSYSKQKIIKVFSISCPPTPIDSSTLPKEFLLENCVYPRAMVPISEYKGNRGEYERQCNDIGWTLAWLNPEIRNHRGLIQRAVDSWRNTRSDKSLRSRRVRKSELKF